MGSGTLRSAITTLKCHHMLWRKLIEPDKFEGL
jgi:hypothetical protein